MTELDLGFYVITILVVLALRIFIVYSQIDSVIYVTEPAL